MLERFSKHKVTIVYSLLFAYIACAFQSQLLNGLHYFAHFTLDLVPPSHQYRTHAHHGDHGPSHQHVHHDDHHEHLSVQASNKHHVVLDLLNEMLSHFSNQQLPAEDSEEKQKKKQPEQSAGLVFAAALAFLHPTKINPLIAQPSSVFQAVPSPPPKAL